MLLMMNGAESLVRTLVHNQVHVCFTNPGTSEMHFVAALDTVPGAKMVYSDIGAILLGVLLASQSVRSASAPIKVTIHVPSKSLSIMPYYFGKDKGFFAAEQIEPQLVMMSPPVW